MYYLIKKITNNNKNYKDSYATIALCLHDNVTFISYC